MSWIKVFAPATVANVGPGFDVLGFAVSEPGDFVEVREIEKLKSNETAVTITEITGDNGVLPKESDKNTAGIAALEVLRLLQEKNIIDSSTSVEIKLHKNMPLGSGLGSSGASAVAAAYAVNVLFGNKQEKKDLVPACMLGEKAACGAAHADNVAPGMLGSFVLIRSYNPLDIIHLVAPEDMVAVVVHPEYELKTSLARAVLPKTVPLKDTINNCGNLAAIIAALYKNDIKLLGRAIDDKIVEPARAHLIPGFYGVKNAALNAGAFGCSISGAGPSIFAVTDNLTAGKQIGKAMQEAFKKNNLNSTIYVSKVNKEGAKVV